MPTLAPSIRAILLSTAAALPITAFADDTTDAGLEEVIVTAQFVKQNLQDTPLAITAMTAEALEERGHQSVEDISAQAPNVTLTSGGAFAGPSLIGFIRGVGQTDFNPALEPGVGLYVDDVYYSTLTGSVLDLLDLDRLEVLRGPQGTLAGKNSIGGSIKLYSKRPGPETEGSIEASYGSLNAVGVRASGNFTLIPDRLYARVAGVSRSRDGHVTRLDYNCTHPGSGLPSYVQGPGCALGTEGGIRYTAARAALRWLPTDDLEVNFAIDVLNDTSEAPANVLLKAGPTIAPVIVGSRIWPTVAIPPTLAGNVGCSFVAYGPNSCDPASPNNPYVNYATYTDPRSGLFLTPEQRLDARGMSLNVDWKLSDNLQLQSITGYRSYTSGFGQDGDGSPMPVLMLYQVLRHKQRSQEFRLNGTAGPLDYTVGAFYFKGDTEMDARVTLGYAGFDFIHGPDPVASKTSAIFANGIYRFSDQLSLSVGARYSDDQKDYQYARHNPDMSAIQPCLGPPGTPGNPANCLISTLNGVKSRFADNRIDYRAALSYEVTDDVMTYLQYSTGYKGGGVNPRPFYNVQAVSFEPEELKAVELGVKAQFMENRVRVNAAVFSNKYTNIQLTLNDCTAQFGPVFGRPCLANSNAGDADVKGGELEIDVRPAGGLRLDASVSYLDFQFKTINPVTGLDLDKVMPYTPKFKWNLGLQYDFETAFGTFSPRVDAAYQDDAFTAPDNTLVGRIDGYTLVNARITWRAKDDTWQAVLEGRNLSDKLYYTSKTDALPGLGGAAYGAPALPRTYMLSIKRSF
jgi:iron complex outermembrane recepter protein